MKKLTGYIGAMIIVFALMGSILTGYALNVNGQSTVINEYESVTDVSGLYSYTDEKTYIEYNPASNYVNYELGEPLDITFTNNNDYHAYYKEFITGFSGISTSRYYSNGVYNDGVSVPNTSASSYTGLGKYVVWVGENFVGWVYAPSSGSISMAYEITTWSGDTPTTTTRYSNDVTISYSNNNITVSADGNTYNVFCRNLFIPYSGGDLSVVISHDSYITYPDPWISGDQINVAQVSMYDGQTLTNPLYKVTIAGNNGWRYYIVPTTVNYHQNGTTGINYIESNRVNNYPIEVDQGSNSTQNGTINLSNVSATEYWPAGLPNSSMKVYSWAPNPGALYPIGWVGFPIYTITSSNAFTTNYLHMYRLSDVLLNYSIPANTSSLTINANGTSYKTITSGGSPGFTVNIDNNMAGFVNYDDYQSVYDPFLMNNVFGEKDYLVYDLSNNTVSVYSWDGIKKYTNTPDKIMVCFSDNNNYVKYSYCYDSSRDGNNNDGFYVEFADRPAPTLNITANISIGAVTHYVDITKGYSIKNTNVDNVTWDNEYENGVIQLLFRAENTTNSYSNTLTISNNTIDIGYSGGRFAVDLNSAGTVDIGTWRSIVLNVDLINGKLTAIPVRTFNSYTNVQFDNTSIFIGDMVGAAPTNVIIWSPTSESLIFNVYSTSVFMDTYGVVMVNPSLNIVNYFPDLNNFYKLNLYNFAKYGDSITINGITGTIAGNNLTINDETVALKNMSVIYADGNVTVEDSNVSIDLGAITDTNISMTGAWYFQTGLYKGYTDTKTIYEWDWGDFILDNTQFVIIYMGFAFAALIVAKRFCSLSIIDYCVFIASIILALGVQVIA